jgi:hypothetical protein
MSEDLVSKMRQAADAVISSNQPADDVPLGRSAEQEPEKAEAGAAEAEETADATDEAVEPSNEGEAEEELAEPAKDSDDDEFMLIRRQQEKRVQKAELRAKELESKLAQATEEVDRTRKQVAEDIFKKLRRKPIATFKEFGLEFQDLIDAGIRETQGTDDRVVSEIDELRNELRELREERKAVKEREEEASMQRQYQEARNQFLDMVTKKDFPTLYNMFEDDPDALWVEAQRIAEKVAEQDDEIDDLEVIKMLEEKYRNRLKKLGGGTPVAAAPKKGAPKTLTTKAASEVRTTGKPFGQLSMDEQKEALKAAVKKALNQAPN